MLSRSPVKMHTGDLRIGRRHLGFLQKKKDTMQRRISDLQGSAKTDNVALNIQTRQSERGMKYGGKVSLNTSEGANRAKSVSKVDSPSWPSASEASVEEAEEINGHTERRVSIREKTAGGRHEYRANTIPSERVRHTKWQEDGVVALRGEEQNKHSENEVSPMMGRGERINS